MTEPTVCAVMLANGRAEMVRRAIRSFGAQTYQNKTLLIAFNGPNAVNDAIATRAPESGYLAAVPIKQESIGRMRNAANDGAQLFGADIIIHWDSDDWSHPKRIEEQVAELRGSTLDVVGYRTLLFWRTNMQGSGGEAWIYSQSRHHYAVGSSLCYWRRAWEQRPFEDLPRPGFASGEDGRFIEGLRCRGVTAFVGGVSMVDMPLTPTEPRMIATIHGANTNYQNYMECLAGHSPQWERAPMWDAYAERALR